MLEPRASDTVFAAQSDRRQPQRGLVKHRPCKPVLTRATKSTFVPLSSAVAWLRPTAASQHPRPVIFAAGGRARPLPTAVSFLSIVTGTFFFFFFCPETGS